MKHDIDRRKSGGALAAVLIAIATTTPPLQAADSYLEELEAEAKSLESPPSTPSPSTPAKSEWSHEQQGLGSQLKSGLSQPQFEEQLKAGYFGSYLFYSKLSEKDQEAVYNEYLKDNDIEKLRELIKAKLTQ